jgi:hypothetical protein
MKANEEAIRYIRQQLQGFDPKFAECAVRAFKLICKYKESDGCLSNTVALYICAKEMGYDPQICYGLCVCNGCEFYHAWLELDGVVIDLSIFGLLNWNPFNFTNRVYLPYIGSDHEFNINGNRIVLQKYVFDQDWKYAQISVIEKGTLDRYMDHGPYNGMWVLTATILGEFCNDSLIGRLRSHVEGVRLTYGKDFLNGNIK